MTTVARPFRVDRNLWLLYALGIFTMAQPGLAIWVVYLLDFRGLTLTQVGIMEAFFWAVKFVIEVPSGAVADRFGRRATFWIGLIIEGAGVATFAFASNFPILLVSYVLWSTGFSFRSGNDQAYIYDALASDGRASEFSTRAGMFQALTTAAFTIAGIGGGVLAAATTLQVPMMLGVVPYLAGAVCLGLMQEPPMPLGAHAHLRYMETLRTAFHALRSNRLVRYALLCQIALETAMIAGILLSQPFLQQHGVDLAWFGLLQAPVALAGAAASIASARAARLLGIHRLAAYALAAIVGGLVMLAAVDHRAAFAGFLAIHVALGLAGPTISGYINDRTDSNIRATIMSVVPLGTSLTFMIVGPFAGIVGDASLRLAFAGMAIVIALVAGASLLLWRRAEREGTSNPLARGAGEGGG
ncbi:MAG: MFS transporter [Dehalococcoidia bacterium]|nr:MFS transporter [Dehalococcoidia bacterium]